MNERPWTYEEEFELEKMFNSGNAIDTIAIKLNRDATSITYKLLDLQKDGVELTIPESSIQREKGYVINDSPDSDFSDESLAAEPFGIIRTAGTRTNAPWTDEEERKVARLSRQGWDTQAIGQFVHRTKTAIKYKLIDLKNHGVEVKIIEYGKWS